MKATDNTISQQSDNWNAFQDSLNWNNNRFQHDNIQAVFVEAMSCGINRQRAFAEVTDRIRRNGKTIESDVMYKLWHSAGCQWKYRQHSQFKKQSLPIRPVVNGHGSNQTDREQEDFKIHKYDSGVDIVIDGLNVIYGTPSHQKPSLMNLLAPLPELQERKLAFKCYFDANTYFKLKEAGRHDEADAYRQFCFDFPDIFIEVPSRNRADGFLLQYAHSKGAQIISNDCYRDYYNKFRWLEQDYNRRVSFVVHSNEMQIPALDLFAAIPTDLAAAESSLRAGFEKPVLAKAPVEINRTNNHAHANGHAALAAA
jgi:hypothetical protein